MERKIYWDREVRYLLFLLPALLIFFIFFLYPILSTLAYSFTDKSLVGDINNFIGLQNFQTIFTEMPVFPIAFKNNLYFTVVVTILQSLFAFVLALALDTQLRGKGFFRTYFFAPVVISSVAISLIWSFMYDPNTGVINQILSALHLDFFKQNWLGNKQIAMFSISMVQIWQWVGFEMVIFTAGLNNIPRETYEVAKIEGASYFQTLFRTVIPQMRPTLLMACVLTSVGCFKVFDIVYIMTSGGPVNATEVIAKLIYENAFSYGKMGLASALSMILLLVVMVLGFGQMILLRDKD